MDILLDSFAGYGSEIFTHYLLFSRCY